MSDTSDETQLLISRLSATQHLSHADIDVLRELPWRVEDKAARAQFIREGDTPTESCLLVRGIVVRSRYSMQGQRQILSLHIPGDLPDLQSLHLEQLDYGLDAVTPCRVAFVEHAVLQRLFDTSPALAAVFWRESLVDAGLYRAAIFRNARMKPTVRLANYICELHRRHEAIGLVTPDGFSFPLSQELIGEALGLTNVSVNRSVQTLRDQQLIRMDRNRLLVLSWDALADLAEFNPTYLQLRD